MKSIFSLDYPSAAIGRSRPRLCLVLRLLTILFIILIIASCGGGSGSGGGGNGPGTDNQPAAVDDRFSTMAGDLLHGLDVLSNDGGLQDAPCTTGITLQAENGSVDHNADNTFTYTPDAGFTGVDTFTYWVEDADGDSDTAVVTITVVPRNSDAVLLEGYGTNSSFGGGAGSEECLVTSLEDSGPGTFRECVENRNGSITSPTPRTIKFDRGGSIVLLSDVRIRQPYLTVDGLDAPAPGITFAKTGNGLDGGVKINTWPGMGTCGHDVLVQGVRFEGVWTGQSESHLQNAETINIDGEDLTKCLENVVLNRITVIHAQDSGGDIWGSAQDVTVQYSAFLYSLHPNTYSHSPGGETDQERQRISNHHNLYAYIHERGPQIRANVLDLNFEQNIIHKWDAFGFGGGYGTRIRCRNGYCPQRINLIENHWTRGGVSLNAGLILGESAGPDADDATVAAQVFMDGNQLPVENLDAGNSPNAFSRPAIADVTLYEDSELVTDVLPIIGVRYRTVEEIDIFSEVAAQIGDDLN